MPIHNQQQTIAAFPLSGKTMADALHWHQTELAKLGIAADQFAFLDYPDDFPDHSLAQGAAFGGGNGADHQAIAQYFAITQPYL
jgi:hypothetical protein